MSSLLQAAFLLPILQQLMAEGVAASRFSELQEPEAIIVAPTRELICQIYLEARKFAFGYDVDYASDKGSLNTAMAQQNVCEMMIEMVHLLDILKDMCASSGGLWWRQHWTPNERNRKGMQFTVWNTREAVGHDWKRKGKQIQHFWFFCQLKG